MLTIAEMTNEKDRAHGIRQFILSAEERDSRTTISITVHRSENLALYDESPCFTTLPYSVETNHQLAHSLLRLAGSIITHRHAPQIPCESLVDPEEPVPFAIVADKPNCHEG